MLLQAWSSWIPNCRLRWSQSQQKFWSQGNTSHADSTVQPQSPLHPLSHVFLRGEGWEGPIFQCMDGTMEAQRWHIPGSVRARMRIQEEGTEALTHKHAAGSANAGTRLPNSKRACCNWWENTRSLKSARTRCKSCLRQPRTVCRHLPELWVSH